MPSKKQIFVSTLFLLLSVTLSFSIGVYSVTAGSGTAYNLKQQESYPHASSTVENVYLLNGLEGASLQYQTNAKDVIFFKYSFDKNNDHELVEIPPEDINPVLGSDEVLYTIRNIEDAKGYYAQEAGSDIPSIWIINYSKYLPTINSLTVETPPLEDERCKDKLVTLRVDKTEPILQYYAKGVAHPIARKYTINYKTLTWDKGELIDAENALENIEISTEVTGVAAPLKDTHFTISGDQFARHFNIPVSLNSEQYRTSVVEVGIRAEEVLKDGEEKDEEERKSAPYEVDFYGTSNNPDEYYYEWLIYRNGSTDYLVRYTDDKKINYTFTQAGNYEVRLEVTSKGDNTCSANSSVAFTIAESELKIPNFFTPDASPGVNDEFKVKHKSIIDFHCTIFNRWGVKIYEWSDPDAGWDGKYKGKFVNPGVYYYVIKATGSDGYKYKKGGDINILRSK